MTDLIANPKVCAECGLEFNDTVLPENDWCKDECAICEEIKQVINIRKI